MDPTTGDATPLLLLVCLAVPLCLACAFILRRDFVARRREERELAHANTTD